MPTGIPGSALPKTTIEDPMLFLQYQRMQLMQNQQMFLRQMAIAKLSQSDHWPTLSPVEQNQLILQYIGQEAEIPEMPRSHNPFVPPVVTQATNPVMQLFNQMQVCILNLIAANTRVLHLNLFMFSRDVFYVHCVNGLYGILRLNRKWKTT